MEKIWLVNREVVKMTYDRNFLMFFMLKRTVAGHDGVGAALAMFSEGKNRLTYLLTLLEICA